MEEKETIQPIEITWEELQSRDLERYILVDTRGDEAVNYGMIPGAIAIPECELVDKLAAAAGDKKVILYCSRGQNSKASAEYFREQGMDVYSLQGGYTGWLLNLMQSFRFILNLQEAMMHHRKIQDRQSQQMPMDML